MSTPFNDVISFFEKLAHPKPKFNPTITEQGSAGGDVDAFFRQLDEKPIKSKHGKKMFRKGVSASEQFEKQKATQKKMMGDIHKIGNVALKNHPKMKPILKKLDEIERRKKQLTKEYKAAKGEAAKDKVRAKQKTLKDEEQVWKERKVEMKVFIRTKKASPKRHYDPRRKTKPTRKQREKRVAKSGKESRGKIRTRVRKQMGLEHRIPMHSPLWLFEEDE